MESVHELRLLAAAAERLGRDADILLRVNLPLPDRTLSGVPLAMGGSPSPFGLDPAGIDACLALLAGPEPRTGPGFGRLRLRGVHAHLASGLDAAGLAAVARCVVGYAAGLAERHGVRIEEADVGGGMAVDYTDPSARFDWAAFGSALAAVWPSIRACGCGSNRAGR